MKKSILLLLLCMIFALPKLHSMSPTPLGMFVPYEINIRQKKPATHHFQFITLGEKSFKIQGFATDSKEDETFVVNALQIYEPFQNIVSMYQGYDTNGNIVQTLSTPYTQLLDSIAGGPGGGVSNYQNGIYVPAGTLSCGQIAFGATYGCGHGIYMSAFLPVCFAKLCDVTWTYAGNNTLFSGELIQQELINSFATDARTYFGLDINGWKQHGIGDLTILAEWDRSFPQRRQVLKSVQTTLRFGLSFPTGVRTNEHVIMPVPFGADGSFSVPFGGGIGLNLGNIGEVGFNGQFWYIWSNEKLRRIKTFPTQTSLLFPTISQTFKEYAFIQNFNLYMQLFSSCKRFSLKTFYQYWRKQKDAITPLNLGYDSVVANTAWQLEDVTYHDIALIGTYSPLPGDFDHCIPQFEIFVKSCFKGMRAAVASTFGAQFSLIF